MACMRGVAKLALGFLFGYMERPAEEKCSLFHTFTKRYVCAEEVPPLYRERYIKTGYRQPGSSISECIVSAFRMNNETLNIWSHLLPLVFFLRHFYMTFPSKLWPPSSIPTCYYPLLTEEVSICAYLLGSTLAHVFSSMTPRVRHICFYVDYVAISMFGIGGACTTYYYLRPLGTGLLLLDSPNLYMGGASLCNIVTTYFMCASRHKWERTKYVIRTLFLSLSLLYGNFLSFFRLLKCLFGAGGECSYGQPYIFLGLTMYLVSAILNATRFPERLYPGLFDILGHNHQFVHILSTLGTMGHFWGVQVDLEARKDLMPVLLNGLSLYSSLGWMLVTLFLNSAVAMWFGSQLTTDGDLEVHKQKKS